ncbi:MULTISPECIES: hypothetical protein [unclassified Pseudoalteromonas]|uniref:hypothetical protein n=1 Tax=unclassified Pseudoalteromonas TaxID=194690 RepID=UPI00390CD16D|nr:hypothetical protein [Ningiella sp. W23]
MKFKLSLVSLSLVLGGCTSETESDLLKTKAIQAQYLISSNGERTKINAELNSGDSFGSNIRLSNGDKLYAEALSKRITLTEDSDILDIDYEGRFEITSGNTKFQIDLVRKSEQNAQSNVDLPLEFTILEPSNNATVNYDQTITVQLDGLDPASQTELILNYGCDDSNGGIFSGSASYSVSNVSNFNFNLANKDIIDINSSKQYKNCELDIVIERFREGEISNELADTSFIRAIQTRKIKDIKIIF